MRFKINLLQTFILICVLITSCDKSSDDVEEISDPLHGTWNMTRVVGGDFVPIDISYEEGQRYWTLDTLNGEIIFVDNTMPDSIGGVSNNSRNFMVTQNDSGSMFIGENLLKLADYDNEGNLTGTITLAGITVLTETELVLTSPAVAPLVWSFVKANN